MKGPGENLLGKGFRRVGTCCYLSLFFLPQFLSVFMLQWSTCTGDEGKLEYYIYEEKPRDTQVGNIIKDNGLDEKYSHETLDQMRFKFLTKPQEADRDFFFIDEITSIIRTKVKIDRDRVCPEQEVCLAKYDVAIIAHPIQIVKVEIEILDINDNEPRFPKRRMTYQISESAVSGTSFVIPAPVDPDSGDNSIQRYGLFPDSRKFDLQYRNTADGATDLRLILTGKLDRERNDYYELKVVAQDGGNPVKSGSIALEVQVLDANDNDPHFDNETYEVTVRENIPLGTPILKVTAHDLDEGPNGEIFYEFSDNTEKDYGNLFGINSETGELFIRGDLDYEEGGIYLLSLIARDRGPDSLPASATAVVHVKDVNDNAPKITVNTMTPDGTAQVLENAKTETFVAHISVEDADSGQNKRFTCSIDSSQFTLVELSQTHFKLVTAAVFDREIRSEYAVTLTCRDQGIPPNTVATPIIVAIEDENDHAPSFTRGSYSDSIQENNDPGRAIFSVSALDEDWGANGEVTYSLNEEALEFLRIDPYTGLITARIIFDHERIQDLQFEITARDGGNPSRSKTVNGRLQVLDLNDERPMFSKNSYEFEVMENQPPDTFVGSINATDKDSTPFNTFSYKLHPNSGDALKRFKIDPTHGRLYTTTQLDRERDRIYYLTVMAIPRDDPHFTSTASVTVKVLDQNDNPPTFSFPSQGNNTVLVSAQAPRTYVVTRIIAYDRDIDQNGRLSYFVTEGNKGNTFTVDMNNGAISVNTDLSLVTREDFELSLLVQDNGVPQYSTTGTLRLSVRDIPLSPKGSDSLLSEENLTIVLIFALATVCVAIVIIIAIVVIVRKKSRNGDQKVEKEKQLMLCPERDDGTVPGAGTGTKTSMPNNYVSLHDDLDRTKTQTPNKVQPDSSKSNGYLKVDLRMEGLGKQQNAGDADLPPPPSGWVTSMGSPGGIPVSPSQGAGGGTLGGRQTSGSVHSGSSAETLLRPSSRDGSACGGHGSEGRHSPSEKQTSPVHPSVKPVVAFIRDQAETEPTESDSAGSGLSTSDSGRGHSSEEGDVTLHRAGAGGVGHAPTGHPHHHHLSPQGMEDTLGTLHPESGLKHPRTDCARRVRSPVLRSSASPPCQQLPANGGPHSRDLLMRELCDTVKSPKLEKGHVVDSRSLDRSAKRMPSGNLHVRFAPNRRQNNCSTLPAGERIYDPLHGHNEFDLPIHTDRMSGHSGDYYMYDSVDSAV